MTITNVLAQNQTDGMKFLKQLIPSWLSNDDPLQQYESGVSTNLVSCRENLLLIVNGADGSPVCVKFDTAHKLIDRGWGRNPIMTFGALVEEYNNNTVYQNETNAQERTIDVVVTNVTNENSILSFHTFYPNGTLYREDTLPVSDLNPYGYFRYHIDIKPINRTSTENFKLIVNYDNENSTVYIPPVNKLYDIFGVEDIYPTKKGGAQWYMDTENLLNDTLFTTIPEPSNNCSDLAVCTLLYKNLDGNSWHASRINVPVNEGIRLVVKSPQNNPWLNTEMTGYYKLENSTYYPQEFIHVMRSGSPHASRCDGYSYYAGITFDGNIAEIQKSLYLAGNAQSYTNTFDVKGITHPLNDRWFGLKTIAYNVMNNTAVKLEIWIDDQNNNSWHKVFEQTDTGWAVSGNPFSMGCFNPLTKLPMNNNAVILWGGTEQQFRADNAEIDFNRLSIREIEPPLS